MTRILLALALVLAVAALSYAQSPTARQIPARQPVKTIKIGKVSFYYYENPERVAASTDFYISGSARTSLYYDFVNLSVVFANCGKSLTVPSSIQFNLAAITYRDGCKYQDNHHLAISADNKTLISIDLGATQPSVTRDERAGARCLELYTFTMPYEQFVQLTSAKNVNLRLGPKEFNLKEDHLNALRGLEKGIGQY